MNNRRSDIVMSKLRRATLIPNLVTVQGDVIDERELFQHAHEGAVGAIRTWSRTRRRPRT